MDFRKFYLNLKVKKLNRYFLFLPLLFYFGKRSLISYDEGFYALQAKWILENNNWIAPLWWGNISLDRTIGIQYLIALSQKIFGNHIFVIYLPSIIASSLILYLTSLIQRELLESKNYITGSIILASTFLWINYSNLATQDIIFCSIVTMGIFALIKSIKTKKNIFLFISGVWIGLGFMIKTFLIFIPLIASIPLLIRWGIAKNKFFWIGLIIGFIPFTFWSINIFNIYGGEEYFGLFRKLLFLSKENNFTNPFYYYIWNIPLNLLPWSIFSIIGLFYSQNLKNELSKYFLFIFPILVIILISFFSAKTPYYPIQILSLLSINTYLGVQVVLKNNTKIIKYARNLLLQIIPISIFFSLIYINIKNINLSIENTQKIMLSFGLLSFSISWFSVNLIKKSRSKLFLLLLGPYLLSFFIVQSGLVTDRSRNIRIASEELLSRENLNNKKVEVIKSDLGDQDTVSKIIKIFVSMPRIGNGVSNIDDLEKDQYAWTTQSKLKFNNEEYSVINDSEVFKPWKLIKKN